MSHFHQKKFHLTFFPSLVSPPQDFSVLLFFYSPLNIEVSLTLFLPLPFSSLHYLPNQCSPCQLLPRCSWHPHVCLQPRPIPELHFHLTKYVITMSPKYSTGNLLLICLKANTSSFSPPPGLTNQLSLCILYLWNHLLRVELCPSQKTCWKFRPLIPQNTQI